MITTKTMFSNIKYISNFCLSLNKKAMKKLTIILLFVSVGAMAQFSIPDPYSTMHGATEFNFKVAADLTALGGLAAYSIINEADLVSTQSLCMMGGVVGTFFLADFIQKKIDKKKSNGSFKKRKRFKNFKIVFR